MSDNRLQWEDDSTYANWKMVHWTWTANEDSKTVLYFIISPDGRNCALIRNGLALYTFGAVGARQDPELGCQSEVSDAFDDDSLGTGYDLDERGRALGGMDEDDDEDDEADDDDDEENDAGRFSAERTEWEEKRSKSGSQTDDFTLDEELVGVEIVDFSNVSLELNASGNFAVFTIEKNGYRFIFQLQGEQRQPLIAGDLISSCFPDRGDSYFLRCKSEDDEHFFILNGQHFDGYLRDSGFSESGAHSIGFFSPVVMADGKASDISVIIDGNVLLTAARIQEWNHPGEGGSEACCRKRFEFDPLDRYLIFGVGLAAPDRGPDTFVPAIQVFSFADRKLAQWPEIRILAVAWSASAEVFELSILSSLDRYRAKKSMRVPFIED